MARYWVQALWLTALEWGRGEGNSVKETGDGLCTNDSHVFISNLDYSSEVLSELEHDILTWVSQRHLKLNVTKNKTCDPSYPREEKQINTDSCPVSSVIFLFHPFAWVKNVGLVFANSFSFTFHDQSVTKSYQLYVLIVSD